MKNVIKLLYIFLINIGLLKAYQFNKPMNFVTVSDQEHYSWLCVLLNSIEKYNKFHEINIVVYDLGLLDDQKTNLEKQHKIKICNIENTNPYIKDKFVVRSNGRLARGWYSWKPVVLKQAFEHFSYYFYIDAGKQIVCPSDDLFNFIEQDGYCFFDAEHSIGNTTINVVREYFNLNKECDLLKKTALEAGIQGISLKVYDNYVKPLYDMSHNINLFADDGSAPWGFGGCRHDQTLFSIQARLQNYNIREKKMLFIKGKIAHFSKEQYFQFKDFGENPCAAKYNLID